MSGRPCKTGVRSTRNTLSGTATIDRRFEIGSGLMDKQREIPARDSRVDRAPLVAYFSMEIGLDPSMPTYAGGLGVLAGDTIRSAADLEMPMVAVTLLHRRGYFYQRLDEQGRQSEEPVAWPINDFLEPLAPRVTVDIDGRTVL